MNNISAHKGAYVSGKAPPSSVAVPQTNGELLRVRASRLVDFFPDELVINSKTISIIRRSFMVSSIETIPVRDIGRVVYVDVPFFAGIEILGKNTAHDLRIKGLNKSSAQKAKEVVEELLLDEQGDSDIRPWVETERRRKILEEGPEDPYQAAAIND